MEKVTGAQQSASAGTQLNSAHASMLRAGSRTANNGWGRVTRPAQFRAAVPPGPENLHFDALNPDRVAVHGARNRNLVTGMSNNLVLVRDLVDRAVISHQDCWASALNALFGAGGIFPHSLVGRALRVHDSPGPVRSHSRDGRKRKHYSQLLHVIPPLNY